MVNVHKGKELAPFLSEEDGEIHMLVSGGTNPC